MTTSIDAPAVTPAGSVLPPGEFELPAEGLLLSGPDIGEVETELVAAALRQPRLSGGAMVEHFEQRFAQGAGRTHGIAVASGTLGALLVLRAHAIGPGDEVIASPYAWHQVAHAVSLAGATPVLGEIDYWSGCLDAARAEVLVTSATRAVIVGNVNGHPAAWQAWREFARRHHVVLIEDATESIGSSYQGRRVGGFGDASIFDFSQPSLLCCGEGGIVVTDDDRLAHELRLLRSRTLDDRRSVSAGSRVPMQAGIGELTAALAAAQLARLPELLERRKVVEAWYLEQMQSFEGIKPPYVAPDVDEVFWMLYVVHLGKRFTASACDQIVEDLAVAGIEAARYCQPLHQQFHYAPGGSRRGQFPLVERIADRALALPLHAHLSADHVEFIVKTLKDSSVNVGAGAAIY